MNDGENRRFILISKLLLVPNLKAWLNVIYFYCCEPRLDSAGRMLYVVYAIPVRSYSLVENQNSCKFAKNNIVMSTAFAQAAN